ncbi:MAG TPA: hypothetical protein VGK38_13125 [Prolixibacteraceae bacterium]|jgi:hypothetical protein
MIILRISNKSNKSKSELIRLVKDKMITDEESSRIYVFPFYLSSKSFYKDFLRSYHGLFLGDLIDSKYTFETTNIVFSTRVNLPLIISGEIENNQIQINYKISNYAIIGIFVFTLIGIFISRDSAELKIIPYITLAIIALLYLLKILKIQYIFNKICRQGNLK